MESAVNGAWRNGSAANRFAIEVVQRLRSEGFQALWAGGCVRDLFLGKSPSDYDVATDAVPEQVMKLFRRTVPVGLSFGVVRVLGATRGTEIEVATFRSDGRYLDGRRPEDVKFGSASEDAARRDFSINGMFLDPISGEIIDYVGGRNDLEAGIVRAIGDPHKRFAEDKLRLLRAVRFAARFGFQIETQTQIAMETHAAEIAVVAAERIAQELLKILQHPSRAYGIRLAQQTGLLAAILPEVDRMYGWPQAGNAGTEESSIGQHLERVLERLVPEPGTSPVLGLAALLHELGRDSCDLAPRSPGESPLVQKDHWGAERAGLVGLRLKLSRADCERMSWLVENQAAIERIAEVMPAVRKRLLHHPGICDLICLTRAHAESEQQTTRQVEFAEHYLGTLPEGPLDPPALLNGRDLHSLGIPAGPIFKHLLEQVRDEQLNGSLTTHEQALAWVRNQHGIS